MRRYLVIAHRTLGSRELLDALLDRLAIGPARFYLVVPERHANSLVWTDHRARAEATRHLYDARVRFFAEGLRVDGEVGDTNPIYATTAVLGREGFGAFDEVILSTMPLGFSKWLRLDVPRRLQKATNLPVFHVEANVARV